MGSLTYCDDVTAWAVIDVVVGENLYTVSDFREHWTEEVSLRGNV